MAIVGRSACGASPRRREARGASKAITELNRIDPSCPYASWIQAGMAAKSAGASLDDFIAWSSAGANFAGADECRAKWGSFKDGTKGKLVGGRRLSELAAEHPRQKPVNGHAQRPSETRSGAPEALAGGGARAHGFEAVWRDAEPATAAHPYLKRKRARPDGLRVYRGPLPVAGQALDGSLLVPVHDADGRLQSWQAIPAGEGKKLNAPGATIAGGRFIAGGPPRNGEPLYLCEGLATAWSAHRATGQPAVCCFGAGNVERVARDLHERHPKAWLVIVADAGRERDAERIAAAVGGAWVEMPEGSPSNYDLNDHHIAHGVRATRKLLAQVREPAVKDSPLRLVLATPEEVAAAPLTPRVILPGILFADVRLRAAPGGVGKTKLALYEAATLALRRVLWGAIPERPMRTVLVTREDARATMLARLREICRAMAWTRAEQAQVFSRVAIIDLSGMTWRLTAIVDDVVVPDAGAIEELIRELEPFAPDWIVFDPAVSFGTGEARTNDAEQGLIEACRIVRNRLGCCVELIHHVGKQNAREGARDQYSFRGGSALADGARMVEIVNPLGPEAWRAETGLLLRDGDAGVVKTFAKMTFAQRPENVYVVRRGFAFEQVAPIRRSPEQCLEGQAEQVLQFLREKARQGHRVSIGSLEASGDVLGLVRKDIRAAVAWLRASGRVSHETGARNAQWLVANEDPPQESPAEAPGKTRARKY